MSDTAGTGESSTQSGKAGETATEDHPERRQQKARLLSPERRFWGRLQQTGVEVLYTFCPIMQAPILSNVPIRLDWKECSR